MKEIWKDVVGYENLYQVSNIGRVKSLDMILPYKRHGKNTVRIRKGKIIAPTKMKNGYIRIMMAKNTNHKLVLLHRIVAQAFLPNPNNYKQVNHIGGNKENNCIDNLEWCSCKQNMTHAWKNCLYKYNKPILQIKDGSVINEYKSAKECERQTGFLAQNIGKVALGKRKSAYGYQWKYKKGTN